jgi:histidinol-phosphate aminotransferase
VGLFNGVDAAIHALFQAYGAPGDRLLTTSPTFGYYTPCARMQGMVIEAIPYRMPGFAFPFEEILAALTTPPAEADGSSRFGAGWARRGSRAPERRREETDMRESRTSRGIVAR